MASPRTVGVTLVYGDTLLLEVTGWMASPGMSQDCQSYSGVWGYSVTEADWVDSKSGDVLEQENGRLQA